VIMLAQIRSIAVTAAVLCFFAIGIIGSLCGLAPDTCARRALLGAFGAYLAAGFAVRAINAIVTQAMIASHMSKDKEDSGDGQGERQS
jgi:hypothetical protein